MAAPRVCDCCSKPFTPPSRGSRARFCGTACRVLAKKSRDQGLPESRPDLRAIRGEVESEPGTAPSDGLLSMEDLARVLAAKLTSPNTPPTAIAALSLQYRATLEIVERSRPAPADPVERLRLVIAEKSAGA